MKPISKFSFSPILIQILRYSTFPFLSPPRPFAPSLFPSHALSLLLAPSLLRPLAFSLLLALAPFSLPAQQQWTEPLNISNLGGYSMHPDMMIDHNGVIHVVWSYRITDSHWLIMYTRSEDDGLTWAEPLDLLQNTELWMSQPHIACDRKNNLFATYTYNTMDYSNMLIKMVYYDGQQWGDPIIVSENMPGSDYSKVISDNSDQMILGWFDNGKFYYRYYYNHIFSDIYCPYGNEEDKYLPVKGVLNSNQEIHWIGSSSSANYYGSRLQYYLFNITQNSWTEPQMPVEDTIKAGKDIALNTNSVPESVYQKTSTISVGVTSDSTMYIKKEENSWGWPDMVAGKEKHHEYQQIAIDQNSDVHILDIQMPDEGLKLAHYQKNEKEWIEQIIDTCYIILFTDLEFNNNKLYIVYNKTWPVAPQVFESDLYFCKYDIITNMREETNSSASLKIYPNPSHGNVTIEFENNKQQHIDLSVFDMTGKHIITLVSETRPCGLQRLLWKGTDKNRKEDAPHLYLVRLQLGWNTITQIVEIIR